MSRVMNAADRLCRMLEEHGVEYETDVLPNGKCGVSWIDGSDIEWEAIQRGENFEIHALQLVTPEQAINATVGPKITEDTSDGWHSFKDLYHHRALLFSVIVHNYKDMCWKSKRHDDGKELDWNFIVGIDTPWGQASYHYGMEYWDMFDCKVLDKAPHYDGYTPEQSVERIARLVELDAATVGAVTLTAEQVRECVKGVYFEGYGDGATHRANGIEETDWQAIADKLNAMLGAGTCHIEVHDNLAETEGMGDV